MLVSRQYIRNPGWKQHGAADPWKGVENRRQWFLRRGRDDPMLPKIRYRPPWTGAHVPISITKWIPVWRRLQLSAGSRGPDRSSTEPWLDYHRRSRNCKYDCQVCLNAPLDINQEMRGLGLIRALTDQSTLRKTPKVLIEWASESLRPGDLQSGRFSAPPGRLDEERAAGTCT